MAEGFAILRFLGKKHGLYGKNDWDAAEIDMIADAFKDFKLKLVPYFAVANKFFEGNVVSFIYVVMM